jgi:phosphatidylglycerol:prolipoprotein diacylglycerol transferase
MRPILFYLGPVPIRSYGFMVFVGFVLALFYTRAMVSRRLAQDAQSPKPKTQNPVTPDHITSMALIALWVGIIGARILFVIMDWDEYSNRPGDIVKIWQGGMTAYGAIIFGLIYMRCYCWRNNLNFMEVADIVAPGIALVYGIGRIGCFLNGCCYGAPSNVPWAVSFIRDGHPELGRTPPSHPAQLYSATMNLVIFGILHFWSKRPYKRGEIFLGYLALFFIYRTIYEQFRKGFTADVFILGLTHAQLFNMICLPVVLFLIWRLRSRGRRLALERA